MSVVRAWITPYSLNYTRGNTGRVEMVDLQALRPDPRRYMRAGVKYDARVTFSNEVSPLGGMYPYPSVIDVLVGGGQMRFIKVR